MADLDDETLNRLIQTIPLAYRKESIEAITRLEAGLELTGFKSVTWQDALERYRLSRKTPGARGLAMRGLLPDFVMGLAKELDSVFHKIYEFSPEDFATEGMKGFVKSLEQKRLSDRALQRKQSAAAENAKVRKKVVLAALANITTDPTQKPLAWLIGRVQDEWQRQFPDDESPPSRNTFRPLIQELLPNHPRFLNKK